MCLNDTARRDLSSSRTYRLPQLSCLRPRPCKATQHRGRSAGPPAATGHTDRVTLHEGTLDAYFLTFFHHKHIIHDFIARLGGAHTSVRRWRSFPGALVKTATFHTARDG